MFFCVGEGAEANAGKGENANTGEMARRTTPEIIRIIVIYKVCIVKYKKLEFNLYYTII